MSQTTDNIIYSDDLKRAEDFEDKEITAAVIKDGTESVGRFAFYEWSGLQSVTIPGSVTEIGERAFEKCGNLKEVIYLGTEKEWGRIKFARRSEKAEIRKLIRQFALKDAKDAKVKEIQAAGLESFMSVMKEINPSFSFQILNATKTSQSLFIMSGKNAAVVQLSSGISSWAEKFQSFLSIFCDGTKTNEEINGAFAACRIKLAEIKKNFPKPRLEADEMNLFVDRLPEMKEENPGDISSSFLYNAKIKKLAFARNTLIDWSTFKDNKSLESLVLPEGLAEIGDHGFFYCQALRSVVIPDSVTSIGEWAFYECTELQDLVIPPGVTRIGSCAFYNCGKLRSLVIPEGVETIENGTFLLCAGLQSLVIPESVTSIGKKAFSHCLSLRSIVIPETVASIGNSAFSDCMNLQSIVIPKGVEAIGTSTFSGCRSLQSIVLPEGLAEIGERAFWECENLQSLVIPDGAAKIGEYAFRLCRNLQSLVVPDSVAYIGEQAFFGCENLTVTFCGTKEEWEKIEGVEKCEAGKVEFRPARSCGR